MRVRNPRAARTSVRHAAGARKIAKDGAGDALSVSGRRHKPHGLNEPRVKEDPTMAAPLQLTDPETTLLKELRHSDEARLRVEIARTDRRALKDELKRRGELLAGLLSKVEAIDASHGMGGLRGASGRLSREPLQHEDGGAPMARRATIDAVQFTPQEIRRVASEDPTRLRALFPTAPGALLKALCQETAERCLAELGATAADGDSGRISKAGAAGAEVANDRVYTKSPEGVGKQLPTTGGEDHAPEARQCGQAGQRGRRPKRRNEPESPLPTAGRSAPGSRSPLHEVRDTAPRATVLLADDSEADRKIALRILEQAGYVVIAAVDGARAVETFRTDLSLGVAVLEYAMSDPDGEETCRRLRLLRPDLPVVFYSGPLGPETTERLCRTGISVLPKPLRPIQLVDAVGSAVRGSIQSSTK